MTFQTVNPYDNKLVKSFDELSSDQLDNAIGAADEAFGSWKKQTIADRRTILNKFAEQLLKRIDEFAELITLEMGKRLEESKSELQFCAKIINFYADNAAEFLADKPMPTKSGDAYIHYEPIGALLGVMPWNFPFYQVIRFASPNLMCGNVVLIKHASNVPQCALAIEKLFDEVGLPKGVYTNLFIPTDFVSGVIDDPRIQGVSLTGSEGAGSAVAERAGKQLKKSVLELGGNDAFIVLEDADLPSTVKSAILGRMRNAGQSCVASKRFIVVEPVAKEFLAAFKEGVESMKIGNPMDSETDLGPLSTERAAKTLAEQVKGSVVAGATVVIGGDRPDREGAFYNPTILTDITPEMPTYNEELFGPVASVYVVKDEAEAIELANDSSFGLGGSVYTQDIERGKRVAEQIETGMMFINKPTQSQEDLPFGGTKRSGYGRELSYLGIEEFLNKKLIHAPKSK